MPIGLTPGHLSSGINLQATKALRWSRLMGVVHIRFPTLARAEQSAFEDLKELQLGRPFEWPRHSDSQRELDSQALGSPAANCLLRQIFLEDVSYQGFHGWYVVE